MRGRRSRAGCLEGDCRDDAGDWVKGFRLRIEERVVESMLKALGVH